MTKAEAIKQLEEVQEAMKASDFGDTFADSPESSLEDAARVTVDLSITLLKESEFKENK